MAYYSGSANSLADILSALQAACIAHGWSVVGGGNVLQKGSAYVAVTVSGNSLFVRGGTGVSGTTVSGASPYSVRLGELNSSVALAWPSSYEIFLFEEPDEVFLVVNSNVDRYYWLAFGISAISGVPGTGLWFGATSSDSTAGSIWISATGGGTAEGGPFPTSAALFWTTVYAQNAYIHHDFDGLGWGPGKPQNLLTTIGAPNAVTCAAPHIERTPASWNGESMLIPIQVFVCRASSKRSLACDLLNARYVRLNNYDPGQILTLGPDRWKILPWYKKNGAVPNGGNGISHTGTFGWAVRYDGP
ncbi:hypothetical protein ACIGFL_14560 [Pseudomonas sp. NPDC077649]|uniref:hypothetical protein n=1 Tax=Pseudomonas sp. NPDC077649 TaxID=3364423 RepID=UPI0037C87972